ncbi:MAG: hypothetical protein ABI925_06720 [Verrucomicrobiota bacterium]
MKLTALRAFLITTLCLGFYSYVLAGPQGDGRHISAGSRSGFSSDNSRAILGKTAKDDRADFINRENNSGVQARAFGRERGTQTGMKEVSSDFFSRTSAPDSKTLSTVQSDPAAARALPVVSPIVGPVLTRPLPGTPASRIMFPITPVTSSALFPPLPPLPTPIPGVKR